MSVVEELRALDPRDPGRWPLGIRIGAVVIWFLIVTFVLGYVWVWQSKSPELDSAHAQEQALRGEFHVKHAKAINLEVYKTQLKDIERSFGALLRQLPGKTEVPNLLVDISQTGLAAGLQEKLFQPAPEQKKDFYAELPRIVTLHDIEITPDNKDSYDQLNLDLTAKTYRYLDEEELATAEAERRKAEKAARHPAS
jgi:type IV pilus assembly protein PilO